MAEALQEKKVLKKRRSTAKGKFHRIYNRFHKSADDKEPKSSLDQIIADLEIAYQEVENGHATYLEILDSEDEDDKVIVNQINDDMDTLYKELCEVRNIWSRLVESEQKSDKKPVKSSERDKLRVKKIDAPTFSGHIRDYPSFKQDYNSFMNKDPFSLKQCLTGDALLTVKGVDNDFDEMMHRLDIKYGKPERLADAVLSEIRTLKPILDGDYTAFIATVDIVERCWLDLRRMNMEGEMNTATMISQVEKLLPPLQKREWALRSQRSGTSKFSAFLDFLLEEKTAMEYIQSDLRDSGASRITKSRVHSARFDEESTVESLQVQVKNNQDMLKQVVNGLAQVTEALSQGNKMQMNTDSGSRMTNSMRNYRKTCWYHETDNHDISQCTGFSRLDGQTKLDLIKRNGACFSCLKTGHRSRFCSNRKPCEILDNSNAKCGKMHHQALHEVAASGAMFHNLVNVVNGDEAREDVVLMISTVQSKTESLTTLWDPGANISLITHESAQRLNVRGRDVTLSVTKVGNTTDYIHSKEYLVTLTDLKGIDWQIRAYGMDQISANVPHVNVHGITNLFRNIKEKDLVRPIGKVDLLIGSDCCPLLPVKVEQVGNLQLLRNQFGYCIRGSHSLLKINLANQCHARVLNASGTNLETCRVHFVKYNALKESLDKFFDIETLGVHCEPRCGGCKCGKCSVGNGQYTIAEEHELKMIENGLCHDNDEKRWTVSYPWKRDPSELANNVKSATLRLEATEKRLLKTSEIYASAYHDQIMDMVNRDVARKLSTEELTKYNGPIHYLPHHEVLKPESKTTPIRIVFNSSASYMGQVINDFWAKGPNVINDMFGVLTRFRQNSIGIAGDISKMYNAIKLAYSDQHTHRFVWRDLDTSREPDHYVLTSVAFGDRPSGTIATVALQKTADMNGERFPDAVDIIKRNSYVDDILGSVDNYENARRIIQDIEQVLTSGGFRMKHWIVSGDQDEKLEGIKLSKEISEKVLGMVWKPKDDVFMFQAKLNFSKKHKGVRHERNLELHDIHDRIPIELTRRMILGQIAGIYDPLGLITPFTLKAKVLMRSMCNNRDGADGWDDPISIDMRNKWLDFFVGIFELDSLTFERCIKPEGALGYPVLVIFSDGSNIGYGACAYIRWQVGNDIYQANLITAKNRIAPNKQLTIPRIELCGAVLASRIREKLTKEMDFQFSRIFHIVDSTIVRAQIQRESYGFGTFVATRIAEIQSKTEPSEWFWVQGENNPADLTTRVTEPCELVQESKWQRGPDFLKLPVERWPIKQEMVDNEQLPDVIGVTMTLESIDHVKANDILNITDIDLKRYSEIDKLLRVTCIVMKIAKMKTFKGAANEINADAIRQAEVVWIKSVQQDLPKDALNRFQRLGPSLNQNGLITVGNRMREWLQQNWNSKEIILLPSKSQFTRLIVTSIHNQDHAGVEVTLAKLRSKYWIPGVRRVIKSVKSQCIICRKRDKLIVGQEMGVLPLERLKPAPAFYYCAVDLFGPFVIRDTVKKRTHGKAYGVLFNCVTSRSVYIDLAEGYDMSSFLMTLRRFVTVRGYPRKMLSDSGTQLVAASKELQNVVHNWDWEPIKSFGRNKGMDWVFTKSADAPWENGVSEALIKSVKKSLEIAIGTSVMTFSELQTVLFEVSNVMNERPIGVKNCDPNEGSYLCPNDLLLGRASIRVPVGQFNDNYSALKIRCKFVEQVVNNFWKRWIRDYFPTLIVKQKWHNKQRNVQIGDIVMVQDSNMLRGHWKIAQVIQADPGKDGLVRDVVIRYKNVGPGASYRGCIDQNVRRSVHRLVVILPIEEQVGRGQ